MSRLLCLCLLVSVTVAAPAQNRKFKAPYMEANQLFDNGDYKAALEKYQTAFRHEPKAARYVTEGTFFDYYLPRYKIALCYEALGDVLNAAEWVEKSKEAVEGSAIKKKRDAEPYHTGLARIESAANTYRKEMRAKYDLKLDAAKRLVSDKKFDEAKKAFEDLYTMDSSRPEARAGLATLNSEKKNYLKSLSLDVKTALIDKKFDAAQGIISRMEKVDPGFTELADLRSRLASAKEAASKPTVVAKAEPKEETTKTKVDVPKVEPKTSRPDPATVARNREASRKASVRKALLATLEDYREGKPEEALAKLRKITNGKSYGSYHWLKGVYLLSTHRMGGKESLKKEARQAMNEVARLMPNFSPGEDLYPDYIIAFYQQR